MTPFTLNGWRTSAANGLVESLPLQTFDDALILVDEYLANVGGWLPNDPNDATGQGVPVSGETPADAISSIVAARLDRLHLLNATMDITVDLQFVSNFAAGQSDADIIAQMQPLVEAFVQRQLSKSPLAYGSVSNLQGTLDRGGQTDVTERVGIETAINAGQLLRDPRVVALNAARNLYGLDDEWSVEQFYTEPEKPIVVIIRKYTNSSLTALDTSEDQQYVINVSPDDYTITGGVISPVDNT